MRKVGIISALASSAMMAMGMRPVEIKGDTVIMDEFQFARDPKGQRRRIGRGILRRHLGGFDPKINRWTGQPHEHKREIARNLKRAG